MKLHLWYLAEELVVFALFDEALESHERKAMSDKLVAIPRPVIFKPGKPVFPTEKMTANPKMDDFVGERSWLLFHALNADGRWLSDDVERWELDDEFKFMQNLLFDLKVVNDLAERCVKDVEDFANASKDPEHRDNVILVATDHRGLFKDLKKSSL